VRDWLPLSTYYAEFIGTVLSRTRMSDVVRAVSEESGISVELLLGPRRQSNIVRPRQIAMLVMRERCPWNSYPEIARAMGRRDHSTVMHGCKAATKRILELPECRDLYEAVLRRLDRAPDPLPVPSAIPAARNEKLPSPMDYAAE